MLDEPTVCRARAVDERAAAEQAVLTLVRERHTRAAANWDRMAERGEAIRRRQSRRQDAITE
ncbi:hypothetical protein [Sphingomonas sp. BK235]|uniref:hypothetical protein n=1 Tax=Sphingomonas sp. BK235 TaxID=2512131 RepID=UPI00104B25E0|nr:hypothetical protein [Sphingomonas sp. BK235]TCP34936.1 hypothetical protein EV292_103363 [Sphingomonas sp. BK235]